MAQPDPTKTPQIKFVDGQFCTVFTGHAHPVPVSDELRENLQLLHSFFKEDDDPDAPKIVDRIEEYLGDNL